MACSLLKLTELDSAVSDVLFTALQFIYIFEES
ncbi:MAG: hypothetical protein J07HN4v3_02353 [Halonotius sp. J07HN4]|nr:MAG: hypothetical protein J07HN4v3_02353 [Halonotius sp. J07HN4]